MTEHIIAEAFLSGDESEGQLLSMNVGGGTACAFTLQAPGKFSGNEDSFGVCAYGPSAAVLAVADGAGGLPAGQKASRTAISTLFASMQASIAKTQLLRTAVLNGIEAANEAIMNYANGSATTLTVVSIEGRLARCYHVGDSTAMVTGQRGLLKFETVAHSPVGLAREAGFITERDAMFHPDRHIVSNFMGNPEMRIDVSTELTLASRDTVLLASDGLSDNLFTSEIVERIRCGALSSASQSLLSLAGHRMMDNTSLAPSKPDDLTLIAFRKPKNRPKPAETA